MAALTDSEGAIELARALRMARKAAQLTQEQVAEHLEVSPALISSWENAKGNLPDVEKIETFARVTVADTSKLTLLRERASSEHSPPALWQFPRGERVVLICAEIPEGTQRSPYADPANRDHVAAAAWADVDALFVLQQEIVRRSPESDVSIRVVEQMPVEEFNEHVVVVGGAAWNTAVELFSAEVGLPIEQDHQSDGPDVFHLREDPATRFEASYDEAGGLVEDIGFFARYENPRHPSRTVTFCGGIHTRGVVGASICFAGAGLGRENSQYVARWAPPTGWGVVFGVKVVNAAALRPKLALPGVERWRWPRDTH